MGGVFGNIYLGEKRNASEFSKEDEESLIVLATQAGVAIANASLYDEVRSREQWLDSVRDITTRVLGGGEGGSPVAPHGGACRKGAGGGGAPPLVVRRAPGGRVRGGSAVGGPEERRAGG